MHLCTYVPIGDELELLEYALELPVGGGGAIVAVRQRGVRRVWTLRGWRRGTAAASADLRLVQALSLIHI